MPDADVSVIDAGSDAANPDGKGDSPETKELEKKIRNNLRAEYEKKAKEQIEKTKQELEGSLEAKVQARIDELEKKRSLSGSEEDELEKLNAIKKHPDSKAWRRFIQESVAENLSNFEKKLSKEDYDDALDMVNDLADDEKIDRTEFKEQINELLPRVKSESKKPTRLVKLAYKLWKDEQSVKSRLKTLEEKEKQQKEFVETGGRSARKPSASEDVQKARETGNFRGALDKLLGKIE